MPELGPDPLVFHTTNILGSGGREIVAAAVRDESDAISIWPQNVEFGRNESMAPADVGRSRTRENRHLIAEARTS